MAMIKTNILNDIYKIDPNKRKRQERFSSGKVLSVSGREALLEVGATLPNGAACYIKLPLADGFTPAVGQNVGVQYSNDSVHSGYVSNDKASAAGVPTLIPAETAFTLSLHVSSVGASAIITDLQAVTKSLVDNVTVLGVSIFAKTATGTAAPTVDVYEGSSSILSSPQAITAATLHEPAVSDTTISLDSEISVRCTTDADGSIGDLEVVLWCKAVQLN
jgi:hypothetical protein